MALDSSTLDILNLVSFRHYYGFRHFNFRHCVIIDIHFDIAKVLDISALGILNLVIFQTWVWTFQLYTLCAYTFSLRHYI